MAPGGGRRAPAGAPANEVEGVRVAARNTANRNAVQTNQNIKSLYYYIAAGFACAIGGVGVERLTAGAKTTGMVLLLIALTALLAVGVVALCTRGSDREALTGGAQTRYAWIGRRLVHGATVGAGSGGLVLLIVGAAGGHGLILCGPGAVLLGGAGVFGGMKLRRWLKDWKRRMDAQQREAQRRESSQDFLGINKHGSGGTLSLTEGVLERHTSMLGPTCAENLDLTFAAEAAVEEAKLKGWKPVPPPRRLANQRPFLGEKCGLCRGSGYLDDPRGPGDALKRQSSSLRPGFRDSDKCNVCDSSGHHTWMAGEEVQLLEREALEHNTLKGAASFGILRHAGKPGWVLKPMQGTSKGPGVLVHVRIRDRPDMRGNMPEDQIPAGMLRHRVRAVEPMDGRTAGRVLLHRTVVRTAPRDGSAPQGKVLEKGSVVDIAQVRSGWAEILSPVSGFVKVTVNLGGWDRTVISRCLKVVRPRIGEWVTLIAEQVDGVPFGTKGVVLKDDYSERPLEVRFDGYHALWVSLRDIVITKHVPEPLTSCEWHDDEEKAQAGEYNVLDCSTCAQLVVDELWEPHWSTLDDDGRVTAKRTPGTPAKWWEELTPQRTPGGVTPGEGQVTSRSEAAKGAGAWDFVYPVAQQKQPAPAAAKAAAAAPHARRPPAPAAPPEAEAAACPECGYSSALFREHPFCAVTGQRHPPPPPAGGLKIAGMNLCNLPGAASLTPLVEKLGGRTPGKEYPWAGEKYFSPDEPAGQHSVRYPKHVVQATELPAWLEASAAEKDIADSSVRIIARQDFEEEDFFSLTEQELVQLGLPQDVVSRVRRAAAIRINTGKRYGGAQQQQQQLKAHPAASRGRSPSGRSPHGSLTVEQQGRGRSPSGRSPHGSLTVERQASGRSPSGRSPHGSLSLERQASGRSPRGSLTVERQTSGRSPLQQASGQSLTVERVPSMRLSPSGGGGPARQASFHLSPSGRAGGGGPTLPVARQASFHLSPSGGGGPTLPVARQASFHLSPSGGGGPTLQRQNSHGLSPQLVAGQTASREPSPRPSPQIGAQQLVRHASSALLVPNPQEGAPRSRSRSPRPRR